MSSSAWRCMECGVPWHGRHMMASPILGDKCGCGGILEQIAGSGWPADLVGKRVGDNSPCPRTASGSHLFDSEEGSSGVVYDYCSACGKIWDV